MLSHRHHHAALPPRRRQPGRAALIAPTHVRDTDSAEIAFRLKRLAWSLPAGVIGGGVVGWRSGSLLLALLGAAGAIAIAFRLSGALATAAADGARAVLMPSGRSTPSRREHSGADACIMQRRYLDAAALLESAAVDDPDEPEAYLRLARLTRDHLHDPQRALEWFANARATHRMTPGERRRVDDEVAALRAQLDESSSHG